MFYNFVIVLYYIDIGIGVLLKTEKRKTKYLIGFFIFFYKIYILCV
jgi:hypothetical protein